MAARLAPASRSAARIVAPVIEARFDDLTRGRTELPAGRARRRARGAAPDEVTGVLAAAEAAAARGLWAARVRGLRGRARARPRARRPSAAPRATRFAELPLAWFALFEGREETVLPEPPADAPPRPPPAGRPSIDRPAYDAAIAAIHEHIGAGDTYQVNYTLRLRATLEGDARGLYRDLCFASGARTAPIWTRAGSGSCPPPPSSSSGSTAIGSDEADEGHGAARSMVRRGRARCASGSVASVKDRAENAMIVDLLRNDIGRVARAGSVAWADLFATERYETVWQLTSTVDAQLRPAPGLADVFRALFPCGSVTGAPKVSTMQIIAASSARPAASTAERWASSRRRCPGTRAPGSTWRSAPSSLDAEPARPSTAPAAASPGTHAPARSTTRRSRRRGC